MLTHKGWAAIFEQGDLYMNYLKLFFANAALILALGVSGAFAQDASEKLPPFIRTNGEATVTVRPDRAQIDVGVVTQADTSQAAVTQNAQRVEATLARLRQILGARADLKTVSYSVTPNYRYPKEGGEPTIAGYIATNVVRATVDDLALVGKVIDAASEAGSNRIQNLRFMLKDESPVQAQALREAAQKARAKSQALASALGLRIVRVLSVSEGGGPGMPVREVAFARAQDAATPIEPGTIEIRAEVSMTIEIAP
jgi:uncharacterized protein